MTTIPTLAAAIAELREAIRGRRVFPETRATTTPARSERHARRRPPRARRALCGHGRRHAPPSWPQRGLEIAVRGGRTRSPASRPMRASPSDLSMMGAPSSIRRAPGGRSTRPLWQDLEAETQAFGLAATGGLSRPPASRLHPRRRHRLAPAQAGLARDHPVGADVVTADGCPCAGADGDPSSVGRAAVAATSASSPRWSSSSSPSAPWSTADHGLAGDRAADVAFYAD
jgi:hypothetical protein